MSAIHEATLKTLAGWIRSGTPVSRATELVVEELIEAQRLARAYSNVEYWIKNPGGL